MVEGPTYPLSEARRAHEDHKARRTSPGSCCWTPPPSAFRRDPAGAVEPHQRSAHQPHEDGEPEQSERAGTAGEVPQREPERRQGEEGRDVCQQAQHDRPIIVAGRHMTTFADLGLSEPILAALRDVGYESPSPIQEQAIPPLLEGRDVIGQAQTGTGKTAAFGLPVMRVRGPVRAATSQALVLTPTRELCIQVTQALRAYGAHKGIDARRGLRRRAHPHQQARAADRRPGRGRHRRRVLDLISRHSLVLQLVPLRRARRGRRDARPRLPRGRRADPHAASGRPPDRAVLRDDAAAIRALADRHLYDPVTVKVKAATLTIDTVEQFYVEVKPQRQERGAGRACSSPSARAGDRLRAHQDPRRPALPDAARQGPERQGAARRHEPGRARRRDDRVQGRPRARSSWPPTSPRAGWTSRPSPTSSTSTCRPRRTSTCTASAVPAASAARAARSRSSNRASGATSRRSSATRHTRSRPWVRGRDAPRARQGDESEPRPAPAAASRTTRRDARQRRGYTKLIASAGRARGRRGRRPDRRDARHAGLDGEAIRNVRVLERFTLRRGARPTPSRVDQRGRRPRCRGSSCAWRRRAAQLVGYQSRCPRRR